MLCKAGRQKDPQMGHFQCTYIQVRWVAFQGNAEVLGLDVDRQVLSSAALRHLNVYVQFLESLVPLIDDSVAVNVLVPLAGGQLLSHARSNSGCEPSKTMNPVRPIQA